MFRSSRRLVLCAGLLLSLAVLCAGAWLFRAALLTGLARAWIVDSPVVKADAIVVLGGGLEYRPFSAARLFTNGVAPVILLAQPELSPTQEMGLTVPEAVTARKVLLELGVPENAIQALGTNVTSTRDEALACREWALEHKARSVLLPTDLFHTRRARWIFKKALAGTGVQVLVLSLDPPRFSATNWWQTEEGLIAFQNEVVKSVFYRVRYRK